MSEIQGRARPLRRRHAGRFRRGERREFGASVERRNDGRRPPTETVEKRARHTAAALLTTEREAPLQGRPSRRAYRCGKAESEKTRSGPSVGRADKKARRTSICFCALRALSRKIRVGFRAVERSGPRPRGRSLFLRGTNARPGFFRGAEGGQHDVTVVERHSRGGPLETYGRKNGGQDLGLSPREPLANKQAAVSEFSKWLGQADGARRWLFPNRAWTCSSWRWGAPFAVSS